MKLLIAVIHGDDADQLCKRLNEGGFRATRIASTGGFLLVGNATVLVGVEDDRAGDAIATIRAVCHTRHVFINALPGGMDIASVAMASAIPLEVQVGGAVVFCVPVRRFLRLMGGTSPAVADEVPGPRVPAEDTDGSDLVLAIITNEDANAVTQALLGGGYRLTRLSSTGAFLQRGNVTLIIGIERAKVDHVLQLMQANCQLRTEPRPAAEGMPMYSATVFILDAQRLPIT